MAPGHFFFLDWVRILTHFGYVCFGDCFLVSFVWLAIGRGFTWQFYVRSFGSFFF